MTWSRVARVGALVLSGTLSSPAQIIPSPAQRAVTQVLHHYVIDFNGKRPAPSQAALRGGHWTADKTKPLDCPRCEVVHYSAADGSMRSTWTVKLASGLEGDTIVSEDEMAATQWVRRLTRREADAQVLTQRDAVYPARALAAHRAGSVVLQLSVDADGRLTRERVLSGDPMLESAAVDAAEAMNFLPFRVGALPIRWIAYLRVDFVLGSDARFNTGHTSTAFLDR